MTADQLRALLNTIPAEITFVDDRNINRFFNEGPKMFKRPAMAIDRDVFARMDFSATDKFDDLMESMEFGWTTEP